MILASFLNFSWASDPSAWTALLTLAALEIVLGIDNIVFLSILVDKLPESQRKQGRTIGLGLAMVARLLLLASINWVMSLTDPVFHVQVHPALWQMMPEAAHHAGSLGISWKDMILLGGGAFLIWKSTKEIHHKLDDHDESHAAGKVATSFASVLIQIMMIDIIFSLDSVVTAVGMVNDPTRVSLMMVAVVIAVAVMMLAAGPISSFVSRHPSIKVLALSFLIMIGTMLVAEGFGVHVSKGYIYFAMAFSFIVEIINIRARGKEAKDSAAAGI